MTVVHDPGGLGFRIDKLWAFLSIHEDGDEAVVGMTIGAMVMPMVAADPVRIDQLRPHAEHLARMTGKKIILVRFDQRTEEEVFD